MNILVIDDNKQNLYDAKEQLKVYDVVLCKSVKEFFCKHRNPDNSRWDVVLTDLIMPLGRYSDDFVTDEASKYEKVLMPSGFIIPYFAARLGTKYVGIVSLCGHHDHPAGLFAECLSYSDVKLETEHKNIFRINETKVVFIRPSVVWKNVPEGRKNWAESLQVLLSA